MNIKVLHLCYEDDKGGAAKGAYRLHKSMLNYGLDSKLMVVNKYRHDDETIEKIPRSYVRKLIIRCFNKTLRFFHYTENPVIRSLNLLPTGTAKFINDIEADIIQMHWICADTISIGEISRLNKPVVWKLPDMWAFSGAEHYILPSDPERYKEGYKSDNRPKHEKGIDLNRLVWLYKKWKWRNTQLSIVAPSKWLANKARESVLFSNYLIENIPNPIDLDLYKPFNKKDVRSEFLLPSNKKLLMFGSLAATNDRRKGYHHLMSTLNHLNEYVTPDNTELVILGTKGESTQINGFNINFLGVIDDEEKLVRAYNTADTVVLPTEMDNLPNVIKEATCCGIPCVGFDVGGMPDMIMHKKTGYLARPFDTHDLAEGIAWVFEHAGERLSHEIRKHAEELHDPLKCVESYLHIYRKTISNCLNARMPCVE